MPIRPPRIEGEHLFASERLVVSPSAGIFSQATTIGDGAVNFPGVFEALKPAGDLTACIEPGALSVRHIRCFTRDWWKGYPPRSADAFAAALKAARVNRLGDDDDFRTPWESGADPEAIVDYEAILKGAGSSAAGGSASRSSSAAQSGGM